MPSDERMTSPPERIYLQWHGDVDPDLVAMEPAPDIEAVSWNIERVFAADVEYVLAPSQGGAETAGMTTYEINSLILDQRLEIAGLRQELAAAKAERDHWKSNHDNQVALSRILKDRIDMPLERTNAFETSQAVLSAAVADRDTYKQRAEAAVAKVNMKSARRIADVLEEK